MSLPFYVAPEQQMKDRAEFARKGISRGRSVVVLRYRCGIAFVAENPSHTLHKVSEVYDRIGFAAVGRYNEFENLRIAGIQYADLRGYSYDRRDVTGRGLANQYAQQLGAAFSSGVDKPFEVELIVAELGLAGAGDQIFRIGFDGTITDEPGFSVIGGAAETLHAAIAKDFSADADLGDAVKLASAGFSDGVALEVAVLDRTRSQLRTFRRIGTAELDRPPGDD
ncbi:proteasome subunit alpha [Brooklawnia sp.]|uniref:proteasome subunit alpha n=1 Tax=Brooklawnia sp. TaxID=2699740 RepID=UPI00311F86DB